MNCRHIFIFIYIYINYILLDETVMLQYVCVLKILERVHLISLNEKRFVSQSGNFHSQTQRNK